MKHVLVAASLLLVQASAFAHDRAGAVNFNDPALNSTSKRDCWKHHSSSGDTAQSHFIRASALVPATTLESTARSTRKI